MTCRILYVVITQLSNPHIVQLSGPCFESGVSGQCS